jgi:predicted ATPase
MIHLRSITRRNWNVSASNAFPFNIPIIQSIDSLDFPTPVTFFVGENGSGKSTLLEALGCAIESVTIGSESIKTDVSLNSQRELAKYLKLVWTKRTHRGFFLRAEDFFGYARRLSQMRAEMESDLLQIDDEFKERSDYARSLAKMSTAGGLAALRKSYGEGLDAGSHGESFLALFQSRFVPGGIYLLDEPEAPLSPLRQLSLISLLKDMVARDAQFIIATHSPILMAFPGATILNFEGSAIKPAEYAELEHVRLMRDFLLNPAAFIDKL